MTAPGGRTMGEPCAGATLVCSSEDDRAWLVAAKTWLRQADDVRRSLAPTTSGLELAEQSYRYARELAAGKQTRSASIRVQLLAKTALELYLRACERNGQRCAVAPAETPDPLTDPTDVPQDRPWVPWLPDLSQIGRWVLPLAILWLVLRRER